MTKSTSSIVSKSTKDQPLYKHALIATERAAIACFPWIGKGDVMSADRAAVEGMRAAFSNIPISGKVIIGEGERDEAPMLYIGESVGSGGVKMDIAVDPLEGTTICSKGLPNSLSVLAMAPEGSMLNAPDVYMEKLVTGSGVPKEAIDLDFSTKENLMNISSSLGIGISELTVTVLNRPRHKKIIDEIKEAGAIPKLIEDGDILASIACSLDQANSHVYMGIGGAPEGVLAAAALKCLGGQMCCRLVFHDDLQIERAISMGVKDISKKYRINDMVSDEVIFSATGVTSGDMLDGVSMMHGIFTTHSMILRSSVTDVLRISNHHTL